MHCEYSQETGRFTIVNRGDIIHTFCGYAGSGDGLNNPDADCIPSVGPIPRGVYRFGKPVVHPRLGRLAIPLGSVGSPVCGRTGFYIHGDNRNGNRSASSGCIILSHDDRKAIAESGASILIVER